MIFRLRSSFLFLMRHDWKAMEKEGISGRFFVRLAKGRKKVKRAVVLNGGKAYSTLARASFDNEIKAVYYKIRSYLPDNRDLRVTFGGVSLGEARREPAFFPCIILHIKQQPRLPLIAPYSHTQPRLNPLGD